MSDKKLHGVIVPLVTPTDDQDRVDEAGLRKLIDHVIDGGCHGVFMGGSSSEAPLFTMKEYVRLMEIGLDHARGRTQVIGGVMESSTARAIEKIGIIREMGYDTFVLCPSYYVVTSSGSEHLRHFGACRDAAPDMEMVAYNIPSCTGSSISLETFIDMTRRGWISYCKDSSDVPELTLGLIEQGKDAGLGVFMGQHGFIDRTMLAGAVGLVPLMANFEPRTLADAYEAGIAGDTDRLAAAQARINYLVGQLIKGYTSWVSGTKYAVSTLGIGSGMPVKPLEPVTEDEKRKIEAISKG